MKFEHTLITCTKINSKWLKDLNVREDTIKLLEENIGKTFSDINLKYVFSCQVSQNNRNKSKNKPMGPNQTYKFLHNEGSHKKIKGQPTEWEKIAANDATDKVLISKIYKQLTQLNSKKANNPIEK